MHFRITLPLAALLLAAAPSALAEEAAQTYGIPGVSSQAGDTTIMARSLDWLDRAKILESQEDWVGLLDWGQRWTREEPGNPLAWYVLGRANNELSRYSEAIAAYQQNLRLDPADVHAHTSLGNAYRNSQRYHEALNAYREALRVKPDCVRSWRNLSLTYLSLKGVAGVTQALQALRQHDPELAEAWQKLAVEYAATKDERLAQQALKVLQALDAARLERMLAILFAGI
jgi:tetratricopeptide (TPR) repeat protein